MEKKKELTDLAITLSFGVVLFVFVFLFIVWIINLVKYKFQQYVQRSQISQQNLPSPETVANTEGSDHGTTRRRAGSLEYEQEQKPRGSVRSRGK